MPSFTDRQWMMHNDDVQPMRIVPGEGLAEANSPAASDEEAGPMDLTPMPLNGERREHRRFDVEAWDVSVERWDGRRDSRGTFGKIIDLSAGGVRLRTRQAGIHLDQQIRVRLELPQGGGISPFVEVTDEGKVQPKREWTGWLAVSRVRQIGDTFDVAGRLVDMQAMDRGMLGLYLSAQPMAA
jgi:hypothetical protein